MSPKRAERPDAGYGLAPEAKKQITALVNALDSVVRPESGWDPYEVWRTRVKGSSTVMQEREREPLASE
jgi:hypothetical protein